MSAGRHGRLMSGALGDETRKRIWLHGMRNLGYQDNDIGILPTDTGFQKLAEYNGSLEVSLRATLLW